MLTIVNEVRLIPFFDSGGDGLNSSPVLAEVGKLLRVRGVGLLLALRVQIIIHIIVVLIIGFVFDIWPFGLYNEFSAQYPWAIGSVVIGIRIIVQVILQISFLLALVLPPGRLRVIFSFNLTLGIDFTISADGRDLHFDLHFTHRVRFTSIAPVRNLFPCGGRFQLAEDNGQTVFPDVSGNSQSFYFPRAAGQCCLPWDFELELVRFAPGQPEEMVQDRFQAEFCLNAAPSPRLMNIIITSEPPPVGIPPRLEMEIGDSATIKALAQAVDEDGNPTGGLRDVRDLGYGVEFYLEEPPDVLDPTLLPPGDAFAVLVGDNIIRAAITSSRIVEEGPVFTFWPGGVLGFDIIRFLAEGQPPRIRAGGLPVIVKPPPGDIMVKPTIAYRNEKNELVESPVVFQLPVASSPTQREAVRELERAEPFETRPRQYVLAVRLGLPDNNVLFPQTLTFTVTGLQLQVVDNMRPKAISPLEIDDASFERGRSTAKDPDKFFTGNLVKVNQQATVTISSRPSANQLIEVSKLTITPNNKETGPSSDNEAITAFVPPGQHVANRYVMLSIALNVQSSEANVNPAPGPLRLAVTNEETFEEYLRVFQEVQDILSGRGGQITQFRNFARGFYSDLTRLGPTEDMLKGRGTTLWNLAVRAFGTFKDDRPLYYTRLQSIGALRAYCKRTKRSLSETMISQFEWPSRGLEPNGSISFGAGAVNVRKAIITGFDPFELPSLPRRSNPSGLIALNFDAKRVGQSPVSIRTAIFPVRYKEFDAGLIEKAVESSLSTIVMLMTCSENGSRDFYDVERWAGRMRGPGDTPPQEQGHFVDNNHIVKVSPSEPLKLAAGKQYLESTLPYGHVITSDRRTRILDGPNTDGPPFTIDTPFVLDQSYWVKGVPPTPKRGDYHPEPENVDDPETYTKLDDVPRENAISFEGSGGNYLSNEIFYRTALVRTRSRPFLASGHLHVPSTGTKPQQTGQGLLNGMQQALERFLAHTFRLRSSGDIIFPRTRANTTSQPITLTATNDTNETITVARVNVAQPFTLQLPSPLPIRLNPGSSLSLAFIFRPTAVGVLTKNVTVLATGGEVVLTATLTGEGVANALPSLIRDAREREGLSQRELAARLGVAPSTIKAWEAGTVKRPTSRVTRLFEEYVKEA